MTFRITAAFLNKLSELFKFKLIIFLLFIVKNVPDISLY